MATFPQEIFDLVCGYLSPPELKLLRLTSHRLEATANNHLFETITVMLNLKSFERLESISEEDKLAKCVKYISLDGRMVGDWSVGQPLEYWANTNLGTGFGLDEGAKKGLREFFHKWELSQFYSNYIEYVAGQSYLMRGDHVRKLIDQAVRFLPNVHGLRFSATDIHQNKTSPPPDMKTLSVVARDIMEEPISQVLWEEHSKLFGDLILGYASVSALKEVSASSITIREWNRSSAFNALQEYPMEQLTHLSLNFERHGSREKDPSYLSKILEGCVSLTHLHLCFEKMPADLSRSGNEATNLQMVIPNGQYWKNIRHLSLHFIRIPSTDLKALLSAHVKTLRSLKLSYLHLFDPEIEREERTDSVIDFFHFLAENLTLSCIELDGTLSNQNNEIFMCLTPAGDPRFLSRQEKLEVGSFPADCIKTRVEKWIVHEGEKPFTEIEGGEDVLGRKLVPWSWDEDNSMFWSRPHVVVPLDPWHPLA